MKRIWLGLAGVLLLGVVATAVFILVQQLSGEQTIGDQPLALALPGDENEAEVGVTFKGAPELPPRPPETWGVLLDERDGSYLVGSGPNSVSVTEVEGALQVIPHHDGPVVEVVANQDTVFYEDVTDASAAGNAAVSTEMSIQQAVRAVVEPAAMPTAANFLVWGERTGDRVIAEVILFRDEGYK